MLSGVPMSAKKSKEAKNLEEDGISAALRKADSGSEPFREIHRELPSRTTRTAHSQTTNIPGKKGNGEGLLREVPTEESRPTQPQNRESQSDTSGKQSLVVRFGHLIERVQNLRLLRALSRYSTARGGLLSGGIAYSALFAVGAALTITWTVFMAVLGSNESLKQALVGAVNDALPGIFVSSSSDGLIDPDSLVLSSAITPASLIAAAVLVWTSMSVMSALATSVRAMFGITMLSEKFWSQYLRSFGGFVVLATGVFLSAAMTTFAGTAGAYLTDYFHITEQGTAVAVRALAFVLSFAVDVVVIVFLVRVMSGVRVPPKDLWWGACLASVGTSALRILGTTAVGSISTNPLLASFAAIGTLLLWLNLAARIFLQSAAFMANPPRPYKVDDPSQIHADETPNYVTLSVPRTLEWSHNPLTGSVAPEEEQGEEELPVWTGIRACLARRRMNKADKQALAAVRKAVEAREAYKEGALKGRRIRRIRRTRKAR